MNLADLIWLAARRAFTSGEARLGVRLSPLRLSADEVAALAARAAVDAAGNDGYELFVAIATSAAPEQRAARLCVVSGEEAAERATEWRNIIDPAAQQRIVYVATRHLERAGGLQDTLFPITEAALRESFFSDWLAREEASQLFPAGFIEALRGSSVADTVSSAALCALSAEVAAHAGGGEVSWAQLGESLPALGLMRDQGLRADNDPALRLTRNLQLTLEAATPDNRDSKRDAPVEELKRALGAALTRADLTPREALQGFDLGVIDSGELKSRKPPRARVPKPAPPPKPKELPTGKKGAAPTPRRATLSTSEAPERATLDELEAGEEARLEAGAATSNRALGAGSDPHIAEPQEGATQLSAEHNTSGADEEQGRSTERVGGALLEVVESEQGADQDSEREGEGEGEGEGELEQEAEQGAPAQKRPRRQRVWTYDQQRDEFGRAAEGLAPGLTALLCRLLREDAAWGLTLTTDVTRARDLFRQPPRPLAERLEVAPSALAGDPAAAAWREARASALSALSDLARTPEEAVTRLVSAPLAALSASPRLTEALQGLLAAQVALYARVEELLRRGAEGADEALAHATLNAEALLICDERGAPQLALLSPLHPLALGQTLTRLEQLEALPGKSPARRLLARALSEAPLAPQLWRPSGGAAPLSLAQHERGLVVYEAAPEALLDRDQAAAGRLLLQKHLALYPFGLRGLSVAVRGQCGGGLVNGLAEAWAEARAGLSAPATLTVHLERHLSSPLAKGPLEMISLGALRLAPLPRDASGYAAHIELVVSGEARAQDTERLPQLTPQLNPGATASRTRFKIEEQGLHTLTAVTGVRGVEQVERLAALARGYEPRGALTHVEEGVKLSALFPKPPAQDGSWQVGLAARLSRVPTRDMKLLLHERLEGEAAVAVLSKTTRAAIRDLAPHLRRLGVMDERSSQLETLAARLARFGQLGLTSLTRGGEQLVTAALLALALRVQRQRNTGFSAALVGASLRSFLGAEERDLPGSFALGVWRVPGAARPTLKLCVGYAALGERLAAQVEGERLAGPLVDHLKRLVELVSLVRGPLGDLAAEAAREALRWLLMPALAELYLLERDARLRGLEEDLSQLGGEVEVELAGLCLLPQVELIGAPRLVVEGVAFELQGLDGGRLDQLTREEQALR